VRKFLNTLSTKKNIRLSHRKTYRSKTNKKLFVSLLAKNPNYTNKIMNRHYTQYTLNGVYILCK